MSNHGYRQSLDDLTREKEEINQIVEEYSSKVAVQFGLSAYQARASSSSSSPSSCTDLILLLNSFGLRNVYLRINLVETRRNYTKF